MNRETRQTSTDYYRLRVQLIPWRIPRHYCDLDRLTRDLFSTDNSGDKNDANFFQIEMFESEMEKIGLRGTRILNL